MMEHIYNRESLYNILKCSEEGGPYEDVYEVRKAIGKSLGYRYNERIIACLYNTVEEYEKRKSSFWGTPREKIITEHYKGITSDTIDYTEFPDKGEEEVCPVTVWSLDFKNRTQSEIKTFFMLCSMEWIFSETPDLYTVSDKYLAEKALYSGLRSKMSELKITQILIVQWKRCLTQKLINKLHKSVSEYVSLSEEENTVALLHL